MMDRSWVEVGWNFYLLTKARERACFLSEGRGLVGFSARHGEFSAVAFGGVDFSLDFSLLLE
jgi:hypothetical protein